MPKVSHKEGSSLKNVRTVSLGQSPLAPSANDCHVWSITAPANRGQVHPSVTAGTTYVDLHGPRNQPEEIYKVRPKANGVSTSGNVIRTLDQLVSQIRIGKLGGKLQRFRVRNILANGNNV